MLNIIISDSAKDSLMRLANIIKTIIKANHLDADITFITIGSTGVFNSPVAPDEFSLFILEFKMEELQVYYELAEKYKNTSILFFSEDVNTTTLRAAMTGNIRPIGFLDKPVNPFELQKTFLGVYARYLNQIQNETINVPSGGRMYIIPLRDIVYFESVDKKVALVTKNQVISYYTSLYSLENDYKEIFMRCHKGFLANAKKVCEALFDEMTLVMDNGARLPISRTYKNNVKMYLESK